MEENLQMVKFNPAKYGNGSLVSVSQRNYDRENKTAVLLTFQVFKMFHLTPGV